MARCHRERPPSEYARTLVEQWCAVIASAHLPSMSWLWSSNGALSSQECLHDPLGDRCRDDAALPTDDILERDRDGDLGRVARREADEPRLVDAARDVQLRGAGLARHLDALKRRRGAGALAHDVAHHLG